MKKGINANKAMIRALAVFLAIFGLTALSIAGLLEYYASAAASITVSQGVVVELYNASNNLIATLSHNSGSSPNITLTATGVGGGKTNEFYYNNAKIDQVRIEYLGRVVNEAPLTIKLTLGDNFEELLKEIVEYGVTIGNTTYKVNNTGVCVNQNCVSWNNSQVIIGQITVTRYTKELIITGLKLTPSNSVLTIDNLYVVWNPATEPKTYTLTVTVLPA
ncbi:MAG: hypothetical protein QXT34_02450 [Candidatus Aenigmatarchaeota archaeon]